jgi:peptidoglycan/LPS O-acetylase OafA/YrhL
MLVTERRYDIDWMRVIAIGLLLIYHIAIAFQPWGLLIGFIQSDEPMPSLWIPMTMLNVWRIPLLFFVSGMGVFFAMRKRNILGLLKERTVRILIPFIFGFLAISPLHVVLIMDYYGQAPQYMPSAGHLWFLGNIFTYVLILSPLFYYLKKNDQGKLAVGIKKLFSNSLGLAIAIIIMVAEAVLVNPNPFELYAETWHGFFIGLLAFLLGFLFVFSGKGFWSMLLKWKWVFVILASALYIFRLIEFDLVAPSYLMSIESCLWIFSAFAFALKCLNKPSKTLTYLSQAAYPIYIIHIFMLYGACWLIFPLEIPVELQFVLVVLFTFTGCFALYELVIRRVSLLRPLFGLKLEKRKIEQVNLEVKEV